MNVPPSSSPAPAEFGANAANAASAEAGKAGEGGRALATLLASLGGIPGAPAAAGSPASGGSGGKSGPNFAQLLSGEVNLPMPGLARGRTARATGAESGPAAMPSPSAPESKKSHLPAGAPWPASAASLAPTPVPTMPAAALPPVPLPLPTPFLASATLAPDAASAEPGDAPAAPVPLIVTPEPAGLPAPFRPADGPSPAKAIAPAGPAALPVLALAASTPASTAPEAAAGVSAADVPSVPVPASGAFAGAIAPRPSAARLERRPAAPVSASAKTAEPAPAGLRRVEAVNPGTNKNLLNDNYKDDTNDPVVIGMSSAKSDSVMPSSASSHPSVVAPALRGAFGTPAPAPSVSAAATTTVATPGAAVQAAVTAVAQITDAQATRGEAAAASVNLGFKIGEEHLGVRVEMRNGEVRTQFTTDSSELRAALSHEWQAIAPAAASGSVPFADPVFTASGHAMADFGSSRERGAPPEPPAESFGGWARPAPKPFAPTAAATVSAPLASPAGRLLTFA